MASPTIRIVHSDNVLRLAFWQNVAITDVKGDVDVPRMIRVGKAYRELRDEHPAGIVTFSILRPETPVSSKAAREESARFLDQLGKSILANATIVEDQGIRGQMMRTVARGLSILTRNSKLICFGTIAEGVAEVSASVLPRRPGADVASELHKAIAAVRSAYDQPGDARPEATAI